MRKMLKKLPDRGNKFSQTWQVVLNQLECIEIQGHKENELVTSKVIYQNELIRMAIGIWLNSLDDHSFNNTETSNNYREEGNRLFRENKVNNCYAALNNYTKALYGAPNKRLAALCHANRAAALIQMDFYEDAYNDCECAIELGYPTENLDKIYSRQATCAVALKDAERLKICIEKLQRCRRMNMEIEEFIRQYRILQSNVDKKVKAEETIPQEKTQRVLHSAEKGNYVVADEKILENECIMSEKAFAFVPIYNTHFQFIDPNCQNCGDVNIIPFPCYKCSKASYCSPKCRLLHNEIHEFECNGFNKLIFFEIGIGHLAFRTFLIGFPILIAHILRTLPRQSIRVKEMWSKVMEFANNDNCEYASVIKLSTNFNKIASKDYLQYSLTSTMLTTYLMKMTNFMEKYITKECYKIMPNKLDWEILINAIILRHLGQMICNAHTISDLRLSVDKRKNIYSSKTHLLHGKLRYYYEIVSFYAAIYPRISLYNHSCEPNFRNQFDGINLNIVANRNLNSGDEILNCYSKHYKKMSRNARLSDLNQQYYFACKCSHCTNETDTAYKHFHTLRCNRKYCAHVFFPDKLPENWWHEEYYDRNLKIMCPKCNIQINFEWYNEFSDIMSKLMLTTNRKNSVLERIFELYSMGRTILVGAHPLKLNMIIIGLEQAVIALTTENGRINKKLYDKYIKMSIDWLNWIEEYHGYYDLEYVSASTYILDMLVLLKSRGISMNFDYDLLKIKKSFQIVSKKTRSLFENYFEAYVKELI